MSRPGSFARLVSETPSTQDEVKRWLGANSLEESPTRSVWIRALRQSSGRGRQGRAWIAHEGDLLVSCGVEFPPNAWHRGLLTLVAGESLWRAVTELMPGSEQRCLMKWPNDLCVSASGSARLKKLAGCLAESHGKKQVVVGWGLNVRGLTDRGAGLDWRYESASLEALGDPPEIEHLLGQLAANFLGSLNDWAEQGEDFERDLVDRLARGAMHAFWGRRGRLPKSEEIVTAEGLDASGALLARDEQDQVRALNSGEFELL